jgi:hypothetical protein
LRRSIFRVDCAAVWSALICPLIITQVWRLGATPACDFLVHWPSCRHMYGCLVGSPSTRIATRMIRRRGALQTEPVRCRCPVVQLRVCISTPLHTLVIIYQTQHVVILTCWVSHKKPPPSQELDALGDGRGLCGGSIMPRSGSTNTDLS